MSLDVHFRMRVPNTKAKDKGMRVYMHVNDMLRACLVEKWVRKEKRVEFVLY